MIKEISGLLVHQVANIMPMMSSAELDALAIDIQEHGLREPIWLFRKDDVEYIVDGRNRALACQRINVIPEYRYYDGTEESLLNFVISLNISRRHLSPGQKACLAVEILPMIELQTKKNLSEKMKTIRSGGTVDKGKSSSVVAGEMFGVSGTNIKNAKKLHNENKEVFGQVMSGELSLNKAMVMLKNEDKTNLSKPPESVETSVSSEDKTNLSKPPELIVLNKLENKKVSELVEFGMDRVKAERYIVTKRKPKTVAKLKTSFSNRIEFKVDESEKSELMAAAKGKGMSLSEYIRSLIKKG